MNPDILEIKSLTKSFSRKIKNLKGIEDVEEYAILSKLNLNLKIGEITAIIGGNGAGKTTLFNILCGFVKPDSGNILFNNQGKISNLLNKSPHQIANLGIGRMFQDNHLFPDMSILDNMLVSKSNHYTHSIISSIFRKRKISLQEKKDIETVRGVFAELLGEDNVFWDMRMQPARNLSYGQQRILGLARLFMQDYKLLLLDEPTAGVNNEVIVQIKRIISSFAEKGKTVLLIEHNLDFVRSVAGFCCYLDKGNIQITGTPIEVTSNNSVKSSYLGL